MGLHHINACLGMCICTPLQGVCHFKFGIGWRQFCLVPHPYLSPFQGNDDGVPIVIVGQFPRGGNCHFPPRPIRIVGWVGEGGGAAILSGAVSPSIKGEVYPFHNELIAIIIRIYIFRANRQRGRGWGGRWGLRHIQRLLLDHVDGDNVILDAWAGVAKPMRWVKWIGAFIVTTWGGD